MPVRPRRPRNAPAWMFALLAVFLLGAGLLVVLLAGGDEFTIPFTDQTISLRFGDDEGPTGVPEGLVGVPISNRPIPAYRKLTREDIWDNENQTWALTFVSQEGIDRVGMITSPREIIGRVMDHEKPRGFVFTEGDFMPKGTRPGLVAGIPPGKRAVTVDATRVKGLAGLHPGDRFDLVATLPIDDRANKLSNELYEGVWGNQMALQANMTNAGKQATVRSIVQSGVVVSPMSIREVPVSQQSLTQGLVTRTRPVQEVVIAVAPEEVPDVVEALAIDAAIDCVPRSGHPDDPVDSVTPSSTPNMPMWSPYGTEGDGSETMQLIETIDGDKRSLQPVPRLPPDEEP